MKSDLRYLDPIQGSEEQTFTGQFEGNVPSRLECVERTIGRLRVAYSASEPCLTHWDLLRRE